MPLRRIGHEISPDLASKSLSALKDRKEEIITELGDIVGQFRLKSFLILNFPEDILSISIFRSVFITHDKLIFNQIS